MESLKADVGRIRSIVRAAIAFMYVLLAWWLRVVQTVLYMVGIIWPSVESLLQHASSLGDERPFPAADTPSRIRIVERAGRRFLALGTEEVVVVGGNYVLKHYPWFPSPSDVEEDCRTVVANLKKASWTVPGKRVVPCLRLGCLWSGAMPTPGVLDPTWVAKLRETVAIFERYGIYCFLEVHQDAMCSTNGGEGIPHWVAEHFQASPQTPSNESYVVSPSHPLAIALPRRLEWLWRRVVSVATAEGEDDPWMAFSVDDKAAGRDPSLMNIGNPSLRLNNYGESWRNGVLFLSQQVNNLASRLYRSHRAAADAGRDRIVFDGYVQLLRCLADVWKAHGNVIALETMNEPPLGGVWDVFLGRPSRLLRVRSELWRFQAAALEALEAAGVDDVPIAVTDIGQALPGFSLATTALAALDPIPWGVWGTLRRWAKANRLLLSFHYCTLPLRP